MLFTASGCEKEADKFDPNAYLNKWLGTYEGTARNFSAGPWKINGEWTFIKKETFYDISVEVIPGNIDSSLTLFIAFKDSTVKVKEDLLFSAQGVHYEEPGVGHNNSPSIEITFHADSLYYKTGSRGGPRIHSFSFDIKKVK